MSYSLDPLTAPSYSVKEGNGWLVVFNPDAQRQMDVQLHSAYTHDGVVCSVKFSSDGSLLAVGTANAVVLYNNKQQTMSTLGTYTIVPLPIITKHTSSSFLLGSEQEGRKANHARSVIISPDNHLLVAGSEDNYIRVWSIETGEFLRTLSGHTGEVYALTFTTDSRSLCSASGDHTVRIWDATQFSVDVTQVPEPASRVLQTSLGERSSKRIVFTSVTVDTTGTFVAAGSLDGIVRIWDISSDSKSDEPIAILCGHSDGVYGVQFLPSDMGMPTVCFVSASLDRTLKCWELSPDEQQFACKKTLCGHKDAVLSVSVLQVGREQRLASSSRDGTVRLWDLRSGKPYLMIQGHTNTVTSVDLSSDGTTLASGSGDHHVRIWKYVLQ